MNKHQYTTVCYCGNSGMSIDCMSSLSTLYIGYSSVLQQSTTTVYVMQESEHSLTSTVLNDLFCLLDAVWRFLASMLLPFYESNIIVIKHFFFSSMTSFYSHMSYLLV
jgi:ribosome-associated toxin RatA of RatAB toxin-antitoxin module